MARQWGSSPFAARGDPIPPNLVLSRDALTYPDPRWRAHMLTTNNPTWGFFGTIGQSADAGEAWAGRLAGRDTLARLPCATGAEAPRRSRPDAKIVYGGEVSSCPPRMVVLRASLPACCTRREGLCPSTYGPLVCRFSDAGKDELTTRHGGRRPKSAKARNRGSGAPGGAANDYGDLATSRATRNLDSGP